MMKVTEDREPVSYIDVAKIRALVDNDTRDLVLTSEPAQNPIVGKWVYKIKHNTDGTIN
jgi:hypothetical protein